MRSDNKILIAFFLNFAFSIFELVGGLLTNSVAIMSDSVHDIGDAISIGISWVLEKKSKSKPNKDYTYGYARYAVLGSVFTTIVLLLGSCFVIYNATRRIVNPENIDYNGMMLFAIIGVVVNLAATWATRGGDSLNQTAVNLHMIEDVAGWAIVLIGAIIMRIAGHLDSVRLNAIDPIMSIAIAVYISYNAYTNLRDALVVFLEKAPMEPSTTKIKSCLRELDGVLDVHHIHVWSLDGKHNCATMHVVTDTNHAEIKKLIRDRLKKIGISHSTLELESKWEHCSNRHCRVDVEMHLGCACHNH